MSKKYLDEYDDDVIPAPQPWKPVKYMKKGMEWLLSHSAAGLFIPPGLRKTSITLGAIKMLGKQGASVRTLVIAPLRPCYGVWDSENPRSELRKWIDFHDLSSVVLHGSRKEKKFQELIQSDKQIAVINPEGLQWLMTEGRFKALRPDTLVIDESTKFKNDRSQRSKTLAPRLNDFRRRWILTGTPSPNGLLDLFGQTKVLDGGHSLGTFYSHFRAKYFVPTGYGGFTWVLRKGAEKEIYAALRTMVLRIDEEEAGIELPKLIDHPIYVRLPEDARKVYDSMEEELIARVSSGVITAANAAVASGRCSQIANGGLYLPAKLDKNGIPIKGKRQWEHIHEAKIDACEELCEELGEDKAVLMTYDYEHDLDRLRQRFGDIPAIGGDTNPTTSRAIERDWNAGRIKKLAIHPGSTHGLNPQEGGNHLAWVSLTFNYEHYEQTWRRLVRSGQKTKRVFNHLFIAEDTVDEAKMVSLRRKERGQNALLDALRRYAARRQKGSV